MNGTFWFYNQYKVWKWNWLCLCMNFSSQINHHWQPLESHVSNFHFISSCLLSFHTQQTINSFCFPSLQHPLASHSLSPKKPCKLLGLFFLIPFKCCLASWVPLICGSLHTKSKSKRSTRNGRKILENPCSSKMVPREAAESTMLYLESTEKSRRNIKKNNFLGL